MFALSEVRLIAPDVLIVLPTVKRPPEVKAIAPEPLVTGLLTVNVPVPVASVTVIVLVPVTVKPVAVPMSSDKVPIVKFLFAASLIDKLPVLLFAIVLNTLPVFVNVTALASRKIKLVVVPRFIAPDCVIVPAVSNVKLLVANVAADVNAAELIAPAVLLPMRTFVPRTSFNIACVKEREPVPPAIPIVVPAVFGARMTVAAVPVPEAEPPICDVALNVIELAFNVAVPVVNNNEAAFNVIAPVPEFNVNAALPELTDVLAASVTPTPFKVIAPPTEVTPLFTDNKPPLEVKPTVPPPPLTAPVIFIAVVFVIKTLPVPLCVIPEIANDVVAASVN
jgi:hypothetical protein